MNHLDESEKFVIQATNAEMFQYCFDKKQTVEI